MSVEPVRQHHHTVPVDDATVTVSCWGAGPVEIVLAHDGLGSIEQWRAIPADLAARTGKTVLAYDRPGHGRSLPTPTGPWPSDWLHREADRLRRLFAVLGPEAGIELRRPLLVGHSDGGSIGLLYAADDDRDQPTIRGLVTLAAHSWVEQTCFDAIVGMRADPVQIVAGLARNHATPAAVFEAWSGVWVSDGFRPWDIRDRIATIVVPTLIAQGQQDEYASPAHATNTAAAIGPNARYLLLQDVGHLLHHQDPERIVEVIADFDATLS